jgi:hypothetical protein
MSVMCLTLMDVALFVCLLLASGSLWMPVVLFGTSMITHQTKRGHISTDNTFREHLCFFKRSGSVSGV